MIVDKKAAHSDNQLHTVVSVDIWHQRMGYIGLLELYKPRKTCFRVRLWGKKNVSMPLLCTIKNFSIDITDNTGK